MDGLNNKNETTLEAPLSDGLTLKLIGGDADLQIVTESDILAWERNFQDQPHLKALGTLLRYDN